MSTQRLWYIFGTIGLLSTMILVFGFVSGIRDVLGEHNQINSILQVDGTPPPAEKLGANQPLIVAAYGDSLTKGTGDETLKGYVGYLNDLMTARGQNVRFSNFAINGYTSVQLLKDLTDHDGAKEIISKSDVILLTIGGNDLYRPSRDVAATPEAFAERSKPALERVQKIFKEMRSANPDAFLIYTGLYNPFRYTKEGYVFDPYVQNWNAQVQAMLATDPNAIFVPSADLYLRNTKTYLSQDLYHPNAKGYQRMAERIAQVLE